MLSGVHYWIFIVILYNSIDSLYNKAQYAQHAETDSGGFLPMGGAPLAKIRGEKNVQIF